MLASKRLDYVAITDHNRIDFAQAAQAELGSAIIIGEEITTPAGELIGLFLRAPVPAGKSLAETAEAIRAQGGLVYVPHPFETVRKGVTPANIEHIAHLVDIVEVRNGRALFQNRSRQAEDWARSHHKPGAASSDAHGWHGWGNTYSVVEITPHADTLPAALQAARLHPQSVGLVGAIYPKLNRLRKAFGHA